ncbi:MAG: DUF2268 domain-containing putative Zn-dependent protease [Candidatus Levybacteria bacterium]|nr:DUF2268 domain-containing putative Zn-dependent protease [Candidatus Levybacteria bacterium]
MAMSSYILLGSGRLILYQVQIKKQFNELITEVKKQLPLENVDVVIYDNPEGAIPEVGVGGYTPNTHLIFISLDPQFPSFQQTINKELKRTIAHELHHAIRWRDPGYGETLFEALITEGLADHFDMEINNINNPEPWDTALNEEQLAEVTTKAQKEFDNKDYNHNEWFFGSKEKGIPRWAGYTLGFKLVEGYLKRNPDKKPSQLYNAQAEDFK